MATKAQAALASTAPNLYELAGGTLKVTYSTSSIAGQPLFTYKKGSVTKTFSGDQIRTLATEIGTLVTVTTETVPDLRTVTFTLVLPKIQLGNKTAVKFSTIGITATAKTTIGGPGLVQGAVQSYRATALQGKASGVMF
jgi:hypothetical protein